MKQNEEFGSNSSIHPIVIVRSLDQPHSGANTKSPKIDGEGYFADNLAFVQDEEPFIAKSAKDVYKNLSEPVTCRQVLISSGVQKPSRPLVWKAILTGVILAILISLTFFWLNIYNIHPFITEISQTDDETKFMQVSKAPKIRLLELSKKALPSISVEPESDWRVEYDLPPGIPVVAMQATEMNLMDPITCPHDTFALDLHLEETQSTLVENWFKVCGSHVAYFRMDGSPTYEDVDRILSYFRDTRYLSLKATLKMSKGSNILKNKDFIRTKTLDDQVIQSVEISGYVTPRAVADVLEVASYIEELTIKGDEVCTSLKRSLRGNCVKNLTWNTLQKLHILQTRECTGMFDLIFKCWNMPELTTLQVRQSMITKSNSNLIKEIIDKYGVTRVDFADNVCFDDTLRNYPYMCQASE